MNAYFRAVEPYLGFDAEAQKQTERALRGARIGFFPEWYVAVSWLAATLAGAAVWGLTWGGLALSATPGWLAVLFGAGSGILAFFAVRIAFLAYPRLRSASRAKLIDDEFAPVVTLCYALSRGGVPVIKVFRIVAEERDTYGEISREFGLVIRNIESLGLDVNTALVDVAETTPSATLRGFFEGLVTILGSGADPVDFFKRSTEVQIETSSVRLESEVEQVGMLAEMYVSGLLILPLLLMVILSLLSTLGRGGAATLPLVVGVMIPFGTFAFLLMAEMLVPPGKLRRASVQEGPLVDAGLATHRVDASTFAGAPGGTERRSPLARALEHAVACPLHVLAVSGPLAAFVGVVVSGFALAGRSRGPAFWMDATSVALLVALVAFVPVAVAHEIRVGRARRVEKGIPEVLGRLSGFNERGVGLLRALEILGRTSSSHLAKDLKVVERDVMWSGNLLGALARFRARARTVRVAKLALLLERASAATGDLKDVLSIAEKDATNTEKLRSRKTASMVSYVLVIYVVFAVFLYVVYVTTSLFFDASGLTLATSGSSKGLTPAKAELLFFQAVVLQGACAGMVAGKLGESYMLSGIKHAAILAALAWVVYSFGVV